MEAGEAWLELCAQAKDTLTRAERKRMAGVKASLRFLAAKPEASYISPVIFSLEEKSPASVHALLAPETRVSFDLRGRGAVETWPWIKPETCLLVWDPDKTGLITSGRQLFGNATFQLVFRDGFEALRLLDDDGDGFLTGPELTGLAVWRDANSDGISSLAEVTPVEETALASLAVTAPALEDGLHPLNSAGLILKDGSTRPVWDWFAAPAEGRQTPTDRP